VSSGLVSARPRVRLPLIIGVSVFATIAITAATALPTRARSDSPAPTPAAPQPIAYQGAAAQAAIPPHEEPDPDAQRFTGRVGADLTRSLQAAGVPDTQGREYVAILAKAIPLADGLSVDDRFDLVIEREPGGQLARLLYVGLDRVGRADIELLKWTDGKSVIWVNGDGVGGDNNAGMRMPVSGRVTSGFGERFHPILGYKRFHAGLDLAAPMGSPIVAAADGRVVSAGWHGGYGRLVAIAHSGGIETMYGHMSRIVAQSGSFVRQGQLIGYVGSSGLSTGPHLHYEVLKDGRPVNPASVKMGGIPQLQGEKLHAFQDALRSVLVVQPAHPGPSPRERG
jgi:murein DD-endopeptidase MepM/ murein hydrolase activator NlpD